MDRVTCDNDYTACYMLEDMQPGSLKPRLITLPDKLIAFPL